MDTTAKGKNIVPGSDPMPHPTPPAGGSEPPRTETDAAWESAIYNQRRAEAAEARADRLIKLLRELEWSKWLPMAVSDGCPVCYSSKDNGHLSNCRLAAALEAHPDA